MSVDNRTPFPAIAFRQFNLAGDLLGVVAVRGTFLLSPNGPLVPAKAQAPLVLADTYDGDPHQAPMLFQSDLTPFKPGTDVTFTGVAHSPDGKPQPSWICGIRVGPVAKRLRVTGPRKWHAKTLRKRGWFAQGEVEELDEWRLSKPDPVQYVPIDWRLAYGGRLPGHADPGPKGCYEFNAIGCGIADDEKFQEVREIPAPQIEALDKPVTSPAGKWQPEGLGPIPPWWNQRHQYAGTYDDAWLEQRHPLLPKDFDFRFWQCAHPDLIATPWLEGNESYELENLAFRHPSLKGWLPGLHMRVRLDRGAGLQDAAMVLDGVHFDLRPSGARVYLTWRTAFLWPERRGLPILECQGEMAEAA
jgi:hypothetical protein